MTISNPVRTLSSSNNKGSSQVVSAVGDAPFNETARVDWDEYWESPANTTGSYFSTASQESSITPSGITAKGSVTGTGSFEFWGYQPLDQSSTSHFEIDFNIDGPCTIVLTGVLDLTFEQGGTNMDLPEVWVILSGQSGVIYSQHINTYQVGGFFPYIQRQINETFQNLAIGQYNLTAYTTTNGNYSKHLDGSGFGGYGHASYDIALIPEPSHFLLACLGGLLVLTRRVR